MWSGSERLPGGGGIRWMASNTNIRQAIDAISNFLVAMFSK